MMKTESPYANLVQAILERASPMPLDCGVPGESARPLLLQMNQATLGGFDETTSRAIASALWLRHNYLDESHGLSQQIENPTGSFLHGIMHRREGDFANAKYWFRQAGAHPAIERISRASVGTQHSPYEPIRMVDLVARWRNTGGREEANLVELQQREWDSLFDAMHQSSRAGDREATDC